ncbi:MAG: BsuPI-related putative proteinase inhibitor, partial [Nitrospiria bacterium]
MLVLLASSPGQTEARSERALPLQLSLSTDQAAYLPGQPVRLTLTLTNPGNIDITLSFRSSQQTDFVIRRDKQEIWRWSDGRMFAQVLTQMKLGPNERRAFHAIWDQKDREVRQVPVGSYEAVGLLLAGAGRDRAITSFKIVAPTGSDHAPV